MNSNICEHNIENNILLEVNTFAFLLFKVTLFAKPDIHTVPTELDIYTAPSNSNYYTIPSIYLLCTNTNFGILPIHLPSATSVHFLLSSYVGQVTRR